MGGALQLDHGIGQNGCVVHDFETRQRDLEAVFQVHALRRPFRLLAVVILLIGLRDFTARSGHQGDRNLVSGLGGHFHFADLPEAFQHQDELPGIEGIRHLPLDPVETGIGIGGHKFESGGGGILHHGDTIGKRENPVAEILGVRGLHNLVGQYGGLLLIGNPREFDDESVVGGNAVAGDLLLAFGTLDHIQRLIQMVLGHGRHHQVPHPDDGQRRHARDGLLHYRICFELGHLHIEVDGEIQGIGPHLLGDDDTVFRFGVVVDGQQKPGDVGYHGVVLILGILDQIDRGDDRFTRCIA